MLENLMTTKKAISINLPMRASDDDMESETDDLNVTGLVVGLVFGSAAAAMLVLGGWCVLKKFALTGGLFHAFA